MEWETEAAEGLGDTSFRPPTPHAAAWMREVPLGDEPRPAVAGHTGRDGRRKCPGARGPLDACLSGLAKSVAYRQPTILFDMQQQNINFRRV